MSRRIVVTGGAGFIGRSVVRQLAARGDTVVALVRDPGKGAFLASPNVELIASDLGDVAALTELLRGADAVVHGAGSYLGGHRLPRLTLPTGLLRAMASVSDRVGGLPGLPASLAETISASSVSYFASHDKAAREFGYAPRSLEQGLRDTFSVHS